MFSLGMAPTPRLNEKSRTRDLPKNMYIFFWSIYCIILDCIIWFQCLGEAKKVENLGKVFVPPSYMDVCR